MGTPGGPKCHIRGPKVNSGRATRTTGGVRRIILRTLGRHLGEIAHYMKYMKNLRKSKAFFKGWRGSGHPDGSHLDPKVAFKRGQDSQNDLEKDSRRDQNSNS